MPVMPSPMMRNNYENYSRKYDQLTDAWDRMSRDDKAAFGSLENFLADAMEAMFGTSTDYSAIDKEIARDQYQPIGPDTMGYANESGGSMPSYGSPFGSGWFDKGVHEVGIAGGSMAGDVYNRDPNKYSRNVRFERDVNPVGMYMNPYNPESWDEYAWGASNYAQPGDYKYAQDMKRREDFKDAQSRFSDRSLAGTDTVARIRDRINRLRMGRR